MSEILAKMTRNWIVENIIRGSVVVIDEEQRVKAYCGDKYQVAYMRSAAKPLLAVSLVEEGAADALGLTPAEIAVTCGSHMGTEEHVAAVLSILAKCGLDEQALVMGPDLSLDRKLREERIRDHVQPRKAFHNCSGKHAGMLALCRHRGWPAEDYHKRDHPVQQHLLQTVADFSGMPKEDIILGIDGCAVPVHGMPLYHMALAYLNFCNPQRLEEPRRAATERVLDAMTAHPQMISGEGRFCTELSRVTGGRVIGKLGADGVYLAAERDGSWALAVKIEDGNMAVVPAVVIRAFRQLEVLAEEEHQALRHFAVKPIKNTCGDTVGEMKAAFHLNLV